MADFTSTFWEWFIIVPTVLGILACFWLVRWMGKGVARPDGETVESTGHVWDEDLRELNNPLPRWWLNLFYITLVFSIGYLALYPGLGSFAGYLGWSSQGQYDEEMTAAEASYGPLFKQFLSQDLETVAGNAQAREMGSRIFLNYCSTCHGADARGSRGFPNLRDDDWLWGGDPARIKETIANGRHGNMPAWEAPLGGMEVVSDVAEYVLGLSGREHDAAAATRGGEKYQIFCIACHGVDGQGNTMLGAANLSDKKWLYGGSKTRIQESIAKGRQGHMPANKEFLGDAKVHLLAAYVYGLGQQVD